jgi:hypothetical protein
VPRPVYNPANFMTNKLPAFTSAAAGFMIDTDNNLLGISQLYTLKFQCCKKVVNFQVVLTIKKEKKPRINPFFIARIQILEQEMDNNGYQTVV